MRRFTPIAAVLAVSALTAGSFVFVACGGSVENPQTQAAGTQKAPIAPQTHGMVKVMGEALGEVSLRPEQRTEIEQLALAADARHASLQTGKKELVLALADQVEKGAIDQPSLQAKIDAMVGDLEKGRPDDAAALGRLHAILDPAQRNELADALESKFKGKHGWRHGKDGEGEHGGHLGFGQLKQLGEDLKLTDDQKSQIKDIIKSSRGEHSFREARQGMMQGKKALEAFREDRFDANAVAPSNEAIRARVASGEARFIGAAQKIVPILTPEQRKIAADKLRTMAK